MLNMAEGSQKQKNLFYTQEEIRIALS